jgi:hypothetical protein
MYIKVSSTSAVSRVSQSLTTVYVAKPGFKCLCQDHFESLEVKNTVDELPLKTGKVRKASRLSSKTVGPRL